MASHIRIAKPVSNLVRAREMYSHGLGLCVLGSFENHAGFDGVMLGVPGADYHFEFTHSPHHPVYPAPTVEDLVVFYIPGEAEWEAACARMLGAGFRQVVASNPYWEVRGRTYEDEDGYRVVLEREGWTGGRADGARGPERPPPAA
jgi:hypothetical protein